MNPLPFQPDAGARRSRRSCGSLLLAAHLVLPALRAGSAGVPLGPVGEPLRAPARVAVDAAGRLWVADVAAGEVLAIDLSQRTATRHGGLARPLGLAVDSAGRVYVGEAATGRVRVFGPDWSELAPLGAGAGEFQLPGHLAVEETDGRVTVHVSDGAAHVVKSYVDGALVRTLGGPGAGAADGQFNFPAGLWVSPAHELFVVDQNNHRVQVFGPDGAWRRSFPISDGGLGDRAQGLAGDGQGRLFVADTFQGFVRVFTESGQETGTAGDYGDRMGALRSPAGVAWLGGERLAVASLNTGRVELFSLGGGPRIWIQSAAGGHLVLHWDGALYELRWAPSLAGPWEPVAAEGIHTVTPDPARRAAFYRLERRP
ncbi:MAG: hypothetical protein D6766_11785 [Verrucomicrobia bacterium]|nr:MAG: hypothetical protein D6766_11785 [Verrucomicrobiota bacterium]